MKKFNLLMISLVVFSGLTTNAYPYMYSSAMDGAIVEMLKGNYSNALEQSYLLEPKAKDSLKAEIFYLQGICLLKLGELEQARIVLKKSLKFATGELANEVYISIADTYFKEDAIDEAISIYEQILNKSSSIEYQAMLYFKLGKSYQKISQWAKTKYYFDLLEKKYPDSFELELIKKTSVGGNFFTIQVGCFSSKKNAEKLLDDLNRKGYEAYITPVESKGVILYRVRVGEFVTRIAAEFTEEKLISQEHLPTHIFP